LKSLKFALSDLLISDFPEFRDINEKIMLDKMICDMLFEYHRCKNVSDKFLETDERRKEYNTLIKELRGEIRKRIIGVFYAKC
jgi:hypothetical protein